MFLDHAKQASTDITLAAVDFYITASIGRRIFGSYAKKVDELWKQARTFEDWLPDYEAWRARPDIRAVLGEQ